MLRILKDIFDAVAEGQRILPRRRRIQCQGIEFALGRRHRKSGFVDQIAVFAAALVEIDEAGGFTIAILRSLARRRVAAGRAIGTDAVIVGFECHPVAVRPAEAKSTIGFYRSLRRIVGAGQRVIESAAADDKIGFIVVIVAGDRGDRIDRGRGADLIVIGLADDLFVGELIIIEAGQDAGHARQGGGRYQLDAAVDIAATGIGDAVLLPLQRTIGTVLFEQIDKKLVKAGIHFSAGQDIFVIGIDQQYIIPHRLNGSRR